MEKIIVCPFPMSTVLMITYADTSEGRIYYTTRVLEMSRPLATGQPMTSVSSVYSDVTGLVRDSARAVSDRTATAEAHQLEVHDGEHSFARRAEELFDTLASGDAVDSEVLVIVILEPTPACEGSSEGIALASSFHTTFSATIEAI